MWILGRIGLVLNVVLALAVGCLGLMVVLGVVVAVAGGIVGNAAIMESGEMMVGCGILTGVRLLVGAGDLFAFWPHGHAKADPSPPQEGKTSTKPTSQQ
jgi:hypothetical protein